jgi:hypothetical protein
MKGDGAPKKRKTYGSCLAARGRLSARQSRQICRRRAALLP